jgi:hypothetical protein
MIIANRAFGARKPLAVSWFRKPPRRMALIDERGPAALHRRQQFLDGVATTTSALWARQLLRVVRTTT